MVSKPLPSPEVLRQLLRYEPETGKLFWKERHPELFVNGKRSAQSRANMWNAQNADVEAFTSAGPHGHKIGYIFNTQFLAHRVIWKIVTGFEPRIIDHIDGNPSNNQLYNLRSGDFTDNQRNRRLPKNNTSGAHGVYFDRSSGKWRSRITVSGRKVSLGSHTDKSEAEAARMVAEEKYGFHRNHGRTS